MTRSSIKAGRRLEEDCKMPPTKKREGPVTRRSSAAAKKAKIAAEKPADGKKKQEKAKMAGASSSAGKRGLRKAKEDAIEDQVSPPTTSNHSTRNFVIEACTQCKSFKERADKVKRGLESAIPDISVEINPQKPRRGYFEIREEKTEVVISLPSMKRPFTLMKQLDMDELVKDLIKRCN